MTAQIIQHDMFGRIRVQHVDGEPWFAANDVCEALMIKNPRDAVRHHCFKEDVEKIYTLTNKGRQKLNYVNESGLYALVFNSEKENAQRFKHWVTSEVLPAIRKTGKYVLPDKSTASSPVIIAHSSRLMREIMCEVGQVEDHSLRTNIFKLIDGLMESVSVRPHQTIAQLI